jgi:Tfp pilus assembly protein PilW
MVEFLVAILLTSVIMGAIYSVYRVQTHSVKAQETRLEAQEYARAVLDMMVREIRNAGYNPATGTPPHPLTPCNDGSNKGVYTATATKFEFRYDIDADGDCAEANERITYDYDSTNKDVTRAVDGGTAQALTDGNATSLDLRYFKQDGSEISRPVSATDLPNIQRVLILLTVQSKNTEAGFGGGTLIATVISNADLRNRGLPP